MEARDSHIVWIIGAIKHDFWFDQIYEALNYCEWVNEWKGSRPFDTEDYFRFELTDDEGNEHMFTSLDVEIELKSMWYEGIQSFEESQQVDQEVIDTLIQRIIYGELVYG
jgi:hypothetical protein